ncbi:methionine aminopeptidase 1-like [Stylophora pistillata]|uniref:methionine aminopeptidase 1-like n=1 Tax=Stylophora pistillata TaxID=50429 RepID=UPI000C03D260|nr:methionine aminopeptidase 1-like [Stylophora pistillata]
MAAVVTRTCESPNCQQPAKLQCPTCIKLGIQGSFFCAQDCFKQSWSEHKKVHKTAKAEDDNNTSVTYNPWPGYRFTGKLKPWPQSPRREVPDHIQKPDYAENGVPLSEIKSKQSMQIRVLNEEEIKKMQVACRLAREVLDTAARHIKVGITTDELDRIVHEACLKRNCYPSPLNYHGFPKSCCTSVNEVICHGIPDTRPLEDGDLLNIDITIYFDGFHGDLNETFFVGEVSEDSKQLVKVTHECLSQAIASVKPGVKYREIGNIIQKHAQAHGYAVVKSFCGHGIHELFHTAPNVPHYAKNKAVGVMKPGHTFTIEPMISQGTWRDEIWPDNWTAVTQDGKRSAQFEQTLLVTETGCDILTIRPDDNGRPHFLSQM